MSSAEDHVLAFLMKNLAMPSGSGPFRFFPLIGRDGENALLPCLEEPEAGLPVVADNKGTLLSLARSDA